MTKRTGPKLEMRRTSQAKETAYAKALEDGERGHIGEQVSESEARQRARMSQAGLDGRWGPDWRTGSPDPIKEFDLYPGESQSEVYFEKILIIVWQVTGRWSQDTVFRQ